MSITFLSGNSSNCNQGIGVYYSQHPLGDKYQTIRIHLKDGTIESYD